MMSPALHLRKLGRRLMPVLLATAAMTVADVPVVAQTFSTSQENGSSSSNQNSDNRRNSNNGESSGNDAAQSQIQAAPSQRYVPDQIRSSDSSSDSSSDNRRDRSDSANNRSNDNRNDSDSRNSTQRTRRVAPPSEFETYASGIVDKPLRRFGANLLVPDARDFTAAPTTTVPTDYRINPGDELIVNLTGSVLADDLRLKVDSEGQIFVPRVGTIRVGGIRYGDVQSAISAQVSRQYRGFRLTVSAGRLHGITVYVTGFAQTPGSYTISSLSTLINAVLVAGGPSSGGSFRSIQLRRDGRLISDFDLYDLLLKGDKRGDAVLQNGDVIYVGPIGSQVAVIGSVNNEAIFEARPTDTLTDVLLYAGGVSTVADDTRLLVLDSLGINGGWQQLTPQQASTTAVKRGQVVRVLSGIGIARPLGGQPVLVTVSGEVAKPGRYYVQPGTPISDAVAQAGGLTREAYAFGAVFTRESLRNQQRDAYDRALRDTRFMLTAQPLTTSSADPNQAARVQALASVVEQMEQRKPDGRLVFTVAPDALTVPGDIVLENNDTLYIPPRPVTVGVFGSVPSAASFRYTSDTTVGDYLKQAGGVQKIGDKRQIFVVRANGSVVSRHGVLKQRALPGDLIYVPINPSRGEFWSRLRDLTQLVFSGALTAATIAAVSK
ncbi:MAG: capsule polysaccharide export system periplasmic protein KpsD [Sphingomonadales bacterium]|nr:capsule polysaccharide export system periplasmic protein KpsD [Sphingomonadales bacterium]